MAHSDSERSEPLLGEHEKVDHKGHFHKREKVPGNTPNILQNDASSNSQLQHVGKDVIVVKCTLDNTNMICGTVCGFANPESRDADVAARTASSRKLTFAIGFCVLFMAVEIAGGIFANSLAILTDAAHLLSDVAGFAVSLFAIWASSWQATARQTYGFHRVEILGALVSIQIIWLVTGILVYEAIDRILHNEKAVVGSLMFCVATVGLLVNVVLVFILGHGHGHGHRHGHGHGHDSDHDHDHDHGHGHSGHGHAHGENSPGDDPGKEARHVSTESEHEDDRNCCHDHGNHDNESNLSDDIERQKIHAAMHNPSSDYLDPGNSEIPDNLKKSAMNLSGNINIQGAYLHAFGDLIQSIGVMIAGAAIWYNPEWKILDLICTLLFSLLVLGTTIKMLRDIVEVLMESTPREIDKTLLENGLLKLESVVAVHDLHVWAITLGKTILACHVRIGPNADSNEVLQNVMEYCKKEFNICHVTVQVERD